MTGFSILPFQLLASLLIAIYISFKIIEHTTGAWEIFGKSTLVVSMLGLGWVLMSTFLDDFNDEAKAEVVVVAGREPHQPPPRIEARFDSATGCEYLLSPNGALVPRLDSTGKQVCK